MNWKKRKKIREPIASKKREREKYLFEQKLVIFISFCGSWGGCLVGCFFLIHFLDVEKIITLQKYGKKFLSKAWVCVIGTYLPKHCSVSITSTTVAGMYWVLSYRNAEKNAFLIFLQHFGSTAGIAYTFHGFTLRNICFYFRFFIFWFLHATLCLMFCFLFLSINNYVWNVQSLMGTRYSSPITVQLDRHSLLKGIQWKS